jgi:hypothetical protein
VKLEHIEVSFTAVPLYLPHDEDMALFRQMRSDYVRRCSAGPFTNRCALAISVGADAFGIPIPLLQAPRDRTKPGLTVDRLKLMAFCRVVSFCVPDRPNTWKGIARVFHRRHPTIIHATQKYGAQIAAAMEK